MAWLLLPLTSCVSDELPGGEDTHAWGPQPLAVTARIEGSAATRAATNATEGTADQWSYTDFTYDDAMGFFSSGGKLTEGTYGEQPFINQKLIYTEGTGGDNFRDPDANTQFSPTHIDGNEIFMYYPYSEDIDQEYGFDIRTNTDHDGLHLDTARCIDFLSTRRLDVLAEAESKKAALYGEFQHTFAELIIMRGEGFDHPKKVADDVNEWEIKAVLNIPVTGIKAVVTTDGGWKCSPELVYDPSKMERSEAMEWGAWLGSNFYMTQQDTVGQTAWYVIVPTIGCNAQYVEPRPGERTRVEYIELYDNDGNLQRVSSLRLSNANSKYVDGGWRYPMEIEMRELVPTANPCGIVPWKPDVDLTDERKRGINDASEFEMWLQAYNAYLDDPNDLNTNALLKYGDLYIDSEYQKSWHFYVLRDLDLSRFEAGQPIVRELRDILDGESSVLPNGTSQRYKISGLKTTLVGTLTGDNAIVQNFQFDRPNVNYGTEYTSAVGIIANSMENEAQVNNCQITNGTLYNPDGPGGMVAGTITTDCTIEGCMLSGFLISDSTVDNIVGVAPNGYISNGNNANNVTNQNRQ